jgi:ribosomal protein S18 acetylase RimI-like enzyme
MLHALEIDPAFQRQGLGRHLTRAVAIWAQSQGASHLSLLATKANIGANALYASLGMSVVGQYHYRIKTSE